MSPPELARVLCSLSLSLCQWRESQLAVEKKSGLAVKMTV